MLINYSLNSMINRAKIVRIFFKVYTADKQKKNLLITSYTNVFSDSTADCLLSAETKKDDN